MGGSSARVALVLGAGGVAGGAFHAGVLAALSEAADWDPRSASVIVGTSAGSITGASLRAGVSAPDLLARAQDRPPGPPPVLRPARAPRAPVDLAATLGRAARRPLAARPWALLAALLPEGSVSTTMISEAIGELFPDAWPSEALWICAVRQKDGRRVTFGQTGPHPPLPDAVAASCAIPGFFRPVVIDGVAHIDGGVHSPTNADLVLEAGAVDLVVVSSPMSREGRRPRLSPDQAIRTWSSALLDAEVLRLRRRRIPVITMQPDAAVLAEMGLNAMDPATRSAIAAQALASARHRLRSARLAERLAVLGRGPRPR